MEENKELRKAGLPGESLWVAVVGHTAEGNILASLRNASLHGARWGDLVVLGRDGYTIVKPVSLVERAWQNVNAENSNHLPEYPSEEEVLRWYATASEDTDRPPQEVFDAVRFGVDWAEGRD